MIVTSSRIPEKMRDGYFDLLEDYALRCPWGRRELHVLVIDPHAGSFRTLCDMGPEITP